jgi:hypothetical protein
MIHRQALGNMTQRPVTDIEASRAAKGRPRREVTLRMVLVAPCKQSSGTPRHPTRTHTHSLCSTSRRPRHNFLRQFRDFGGGWALPVRPRGRGRQPRAQRGCSSAWIGSATSRTPSSLRSGKGSPVPTHEFLGVTKTRKGHRPVAPKVAGSGWLPGVNPPNRTGSPWRVFRPPCVHCGGGPTSLTTSAASIRPSPLTSGTRLFWLRGIPSRGSSTCSGCHAGHCHPS